MSHTESAAAGFGLGQRPEVETYAFLAPDSQGPFFIFICAPGQAEKQTFEFASPLHLGTLAHHGDIFFFLQALENMFSSPLLCEEFLCTCVIFISIYSGIRE